MLQSLGGRSGKRPALGPAKSFHAFKLDYLMARIHVRINPRVLVWARIRSRYDESSVAKKVGVSLERYHEWESGSSSPTIRQLHSLVRALNEPLQTFFMSAVPDEPEVLAEMRRLPGAPIGDESPELAGQVHLAVERREIALHLYEALAEEPASLVITADLSQDAESLAQTVRGQIGVSVQEQVSWGDAHEAVREWRSKLEAKGVLVFQIPHVSMKEMRGFSFALNPLPIIGVNSKDSPTGRVFTIFHELIHLLLKDTMLDPGDSTWFHIDPRFEVEHFCNRVAAATLIPPEDVTEQAAKRNKVRDADWMDTEIRSLSAHLVARRK